MICSVCIATYKRPKRLENLLKSLINQLLPETVKIEIIIVDNDPEGSAKAVCQPFKNTKQIEFYYLIQPVKNISLTRNKAIEKATGEFLFFIDDDEVACPEWIDTLLKTIKNFDADGAFGRVISTFSDPTCDWVKKNFLFNRQCDETGTEAINTRTGNCIVKASLLKEIPGPFDPAYGITGGGDTHLFEKLKQKGAKFVNCYEAWVAEFVPPERTKTTWLLKRALRTGNNYTRRRVELAKKRKSLIRLNLSIRSFSFGAISLLMTIIMFPLKRWRVYWAMKLLGNIGHFLALIGYHYQEYK